MNPTQKQFFVKPRSVQKAMSYQYGDPQKQFTAIWHYLMSLRAEAPAR